MPRITFFPNNKTFNVPDGLTVLEIAEEHGIDLEHSCGGCCACSTCAVEVIGNTNAALSPMDSDEAETLESLCESRTPNTRLGCQAIVKADCKVWIKPRE
jgi:2Fe-2S ferredoxin